MGYLYLTYRTGQRVRMSGVVTRVDFNQDIEALEVYYNSTDSIIYWVGPLLKVEILPE